MLWLVVTLIFFGESIAHSWITCTDYIEKNAAVNDHSKCRGWPRGANIKIPRTSKFGVSKGMIMKPGGFDHRPRPGQNEPCQMERNDNKYYDAIHPMAVYFRGQQVVLTHPMKSHGADGNCRDKDATDTGNYIYSSELNPKKDPSLEKFRSNMIFNLSRSTYRAKDPRSLFYPKYGFQNAPKYCEDPADSLGTYSFNVPLNLKTGIYTFMWLWEFKNKTDLYGTCFEVRIVDDVAERNTILKDFNITDFSHPCGGKTSHPDVEGSKVGCNSSRNIFFNYYIIICCLLFIVSIL